MQRVYFAALATVLIAGSANAAIVSIDLSGAATGSLITAPGAGFAQSFTGQTVNGTGLDGSPTDPLSLFASGQITIASFDPGVSPAGNSLLSQPGNAAPLAILLDSRADSFAFTMGSADPGSTIGYNFYNADGGLAGGGVIVMLSGYNLYSIGLGAGFDGISFFDNNDSAGVRFMNMSYNSIGGDPAVPEPASWAMMILGFAVVGASLRRRTALTA